MKNLSCYAKALGLELSSSQAEIPIDDISNDSRTKGSSWLFCAIPGFKRDGHNFLPDAIANGAVAAVVSKDIADVPPGFPLLRVDDSYKAFALASECRFDYPGCSLSLSGVTGTNGKTTIAFILKKLLGALPGSRCGLVSTVLYDVGDGSPAEASRTTPDAYALQSLFSRMRANACTHAVMEVSSHGLHQSRSGLAKFKTAIFTNLTGDHLDYHHDMESYYQAKKLLFSESLAPDGVAVINIDDAYGARLHHELSKLISPAQLVACSKSIPKAACFIKSMKLNDSHSDIELSLLGGSVKFKSCLIGEHNVYNVASAAAAALVLGVSAEAIASALSSPLLVPGRLEGFLLPSGATAFVDYAHTDDALFRVLTALRPLCKGSLTTVFGCGGDRDTTKRPRMGAVAARFSELSIITSDNPRSEDPLDIIAQIRKGVPHQARCLEIPDRRKAIETSVSGAVCGDLVLIAGKGHESYQESQGVKTHFDDREALLSLGAKPRAI